MTGRTVRDAVAGLILAATFCGTADAQSIRGDSLARERRLDSLRQRKVTIDGHSLNTAPAFTLEQALQGRIAGVVVQMNDGAPWSDGQVQIRGASTLFGDPSPLVIVDGVQTTNTFAATTSAFADPSAVPRLRSTASLSAFTPFEIARVEVLKGPAAAARFGARGSGGALVITTHRAQAGAAPWRAILRTGGAEATRLPTSRCFPSVADAITASRADSTAIRTAATSNGGTLPCFQALPAYFSAQALSSEAAVQWTARPRGTGLLASAARKSAPGAVAGSGMTRTNLRVNADRAFTDRLSAQLSTALSLRDITRGGGADAAARTLLTYPSWRDAQHSVSAGGTADPYGSPFAQLREGRDDGTATRTTGSLVLRYDAVRRPGMVLQVEAVSGLDRSADDDEAMMPFVDPLGSGATRREVAVTRTRSRIDNHAVRARLETLYMGQVPLVLESGVTLDRQSFRREATTDAGGLAGTSNTIDLGNSIAGVHAMVSTALLDRSLELGASVRSDRLRTSDGIGGTYPSVNVTYRVPTAGTGVAVAVFGAWGASGSLGALGTRPFQVLTAGAFDPIPQTLERRSEREAGVDVHSREGRLALTYSAYQADMTRLFAAGGNGSAVYLIPGAASMRTTGHELTAAAQLVQRRGATWESRVTVSRAASRLLSYTGTGSEQFSTFGGGARQVLRDGARLGDITLVGVTPIASGTPSFDASAANVVRVGPVSLRTLVDWRRGSTLWNSTLRLTDTFRTSADFDAPSPRAGTSLGDYRRSILLAGDSTGVFLTPGSYVRLREVTLRYAIPSRWSARAFGAGELAVSLSARNLALWTNSAANDPEFSAVGTHPYARFVADLRYPTMRQVFFGVDLGL